MSERSLKWELNYLGLSLGLSLSLSFFVSPDGKSITKRPLKDWNFGRILSCLRTSHNSVKSGPKRLANRGYSLHGWSLQLPHPNETLSLSG